jgi:hypothetical protein
MRTVVPQPARQSTTRIPRRFWISLGVRLMIVICAPWVVARDHRASGKSRTPAHPTNGQHTQMMIKVQAQKPFQENLAVGSA